ncbi:MAG TPA: HYR domain-containing protein [Pirellulaceae bacterium]|jgi:probable HAF family extracellular repeat protein|nr:HYR domain-containing protein [Pirellulaceae bacterium]
MTNARVFLISGFMGLSLASLAAAQAPTIQPLGWLDSAVKQSVAMGVSPDGAMVVGHSRSTSGYDRAFLWMSGGGIRELGTLGAVSGNSYAEAVTNAIGGIVVGHSAGPYGVVHGFRWTSPTGFVVLGAHYHPMAESRAYDISPNGEFTVGSSAYGSGPAVEVPTKWTGSSPGPIFGTTYVGVATSVNDNPFQHIAMNTWYTTAGGSPYARPISTYAGTMGFAGSEAFVESIADVPFAVGHTVLNGKFVATEWYMSSPSFLHNDSTVNSYARDISQNGGVTVGEVSAETSARGDAYFWRRGRAPELLKDYLVNEYGVDMTGWGRLYAANSVSADGRVIVGSGEYQGATTAFRVFLPLTNRRPTVTTALVQGQTYTIPLGDSFGAALNGQDLDNDTLTLKATGLPPSAVLTPNVGSTNAPPFNASLLFIPSLADVGTHNCTIAFADQAYAGNPGKVSFTLTVPPNNVPTASAMTATNVVCIDGSHLVTLASTVGDADGHPLTVVWKVDGVAKQTTPNVASGTTVSFEHDYPHGQSLVTVESSDSYHTGSATTTVTVTDGAAPTVTVAADMQVPTNPGKNFATGVVLTPPTVVDNCDGNPTLTNNAPSQYPLGLTIVTWTAKDADGNQTTATQGVTVVDQDKPTIAPAPAISLFVDAGQLVSSAPLTPPVASDNVPAGLQVTSNAPSVLPLGLTVVTWTAKDAAGNTATTTQNVTVVNRNPKANAGKAIVVTTTSEKGASVALNGSASSDPDAHKLKYRWTAPGVRLKKPTTAKPSGVFPVGTKTVTLTVTDPAGARSTAKVKVTVKLKNAKARARGKQANDAFAKTFHHGTRDAVNSAPNAKSLSGYAYANSAQRIAMYAGDHVQWNEGQSAADATLEYAELRALQSLCGERAAAAYLDAYAETGDEDSLQAALWAMNGAACAEADISER